MNTSILTTAAAPPGGAARRRSKRSWRVSRRSEVKYLELHHVIPWALGGPATISNLSVRCRVHNAHEAEQVFGVRVVASPASKAAPPSRDTPSAP